MNHIWAQLCIEGAFGESVSCCVEGSPAVGGIFSCFIHELINAAQTTLLSTLNNGRQPPSASSGTTHCWQEWAGSSRSYLTCSLQKIWQESCIYAMITPPYPQVISKLIPFWSRGSDRSSDVCLCCETAGALHTPVRSSYRSNTANDE